MFVRSVVRNVCFFVLSKCQFVVFVCCFVVVFVLLKFDVCRVFVSVVRSVCLLFCLSFYSLLFTFYSSKSSSCQKPFHTVSSAAVN